MSIRNSKRTTRLMPLIILFLSVFYLMYAMTRTEIMAHLANLVSRRKFESSDEFRRYICDKTMFGFPYGELLTCSPCLSAWVGVSLSFFQGFGVWDGLAAAGVWCIANVFLKGIG